MILRALSGFMVLGFAGVTWGWGSLGHKAVGRIAEGKLSPQARNAVQRLIGKDRLEDISTWADSAKKTPPYDYTNSYHFEKIEDKQNYLESLRSTPADQLKDGGVIGALLLAEEILRDSKARDEEKVNALKFYVHFVGDLHQPLHTGRPEDRGGNDIEVKWFGNKMSLHGVWDSGMIITGHKDLLKDVNTEAVALDKYVSFLSRYFKDVKPPEGSEKSMEAWLIESMSVRNSAYQNDNYKKAQDKYQDDNLLALDRGVYFAGVRLAARLNSLLLQGVPSAVDQAFRQNIEKIVGQLDRWVSLSPQ